jgi:hypothetical protein
MSGFELLAILWQRFPLIPLIAMSGKYESEGGAPPGLFVHSLRAKGMHRPEKLLRTVSELIHATSMAEADIHLPEEIGLISSADYFCKSHTDLGIPVDTLIPPQ